MNRLAIALAVIFGVVWVLLLMGLVLGVKLDEDGLWRTIAWLSTMAALLWLCYDLKRKTRV